MAANGWLGTMLVAAATSLLGVGRVQARPPVEVLVAAPGQVRVDGDLREWPASAFETWAPGVRVAFGADDKGVLFAADVEDDMVVSGGKRATSNHDGVIVDLWLPVAARGRAASNARPVRVWLHPGRPGQLPARLRLGSAPKSQAGGQLVDGLRRGDKPGYVLEASIPWRVLPGAENRHLARVQVRLHDVDRPGRGPGVPPKAVPDGMREFRMPNSQAGALTALLDRENLQARRPLLSALADMSGDRRLEHVTVVGGLVTVRAADQPFRYFELPSVPGARAIQAELAPLLPGGKSAVLVEMAATVAGSPSRWLAVICAARARLEQTLALELERGLQGKRVVNQYRVVRLEGKSTLEVTPSVGPPQVDGANRLPSLVAGVAPALVHGGPLSAVQYRWQGGAFAAHEVANGRYRPTPATAGAPASTLAGPQTHAGSAKPGESPQPPGKQRGEAGAASPRRLLQAFKRQRAIGTAQRPRFQWVGNFAGDDRPEQVQVYGLDVFVAGPGFREGRAFFFATLPAATVDAVTDVRAVDVTADGRKELLVHVHSTHGPVHRKSLHVFGFAGEQWSRWMLAETGRKAEGGEIRNRVRVSKEGRLCVDPGTVQGWTAGTYPFAADPPDAPGRLLLPFADRSVCYRFDGTKLVPALGRASGGRTAEPRRAPQN